MDWLNNRQIAQGLKIGQNRHVRVSMFDQRFLIPVLRCTYSESGDMVVLDLDEDHDQFDAFLEAVERYGRP